MYFSFGFSWVFQDLKGILVQELDFENEGCNVECCVQELVYFFYIVVFCVYWDKFSKCVFIVDFCVGCKVNDVEVIRSQGLVVKDIVEKFIKVFVEQIFYMGFIYLDLYFGNVLVWKGLDGKVELVLLDYGFYQFLEEKDCVVLCQLWWVIILWDDVVMRVYVVVLGVKDYFLFFEMFMQCFVCLGQLWGLYLLSCEEVVYMVDMVCEYFEVIMVVFRVLL